MSLGAIYRNEEIDPIILQPLAFVGASSGHGILFSRYHLFHRYHVDRQKSIRVLENFLEKKEQKVEEEAQWLREVKADCVLSDAAFLALYVVLQRIYASELRVLTVVKSCG